MDEDLKWKLDELVSEIKTLTTAIQDLQELIADLTKATQKK